MATTATTHADTTADATPVASAVVLADSVGPHGVRLTTLRVRFPRLALADASTYGTVRRFSFAPDDGVPRRSSASSRALPTGKMLALQRYTPARFGRRGRGMVADGVLAGWRHRAARLLWLGAAAVNRLSAYLMARVGVAKEHANRQLEWFSFIDVICTADDRGWARFLAQRDHPAAQPELRAAAAAVRGALAGGVPRFLNPGEWHLPLAGPGEWEETKWGRRRPPPLAARVRESVGRCAGVSYLADHERERAVALHDRLLAESPPHWGPFEHQAECLPAAERCDVYHGWRSYRHRIEALGLALPGDDE